MRAGKNLQVISVRDSLLNDMLFEQRHILNRVHRQVLIVGQDDDDVLPFFLCLLYSSASSSTTKWMLLLLLSSLAD